MNDENKSYGAVFMRSQGTRIWIRTRGYNGPEWVEERGAFSTTIKMSMQEHSVNETFDDVLKRLEIEYKAPRI